MELRPFTDAQVEHYRRIGMAGYVVDLERSGAWSPERARAKAERDYAGLGLPGEATYLAAYAEVDGDDTWVGILGYELRGMDAVLATEPTLYVCDLEVFEPFRRRGYASTMLEAATRIARDAGADAVRLTVWAGNEGAHALYERQGFRLESLAMRLPVTG